MNFVRVNPTDQAQQKRAMSSTLLIYAEHFGLRERPFTLLPDPDYLYWSEQHQLTYSMLEYGLLTHAPITLITGEIGAGKTTLIRQLLRNIPNDFSIGLISNSCTSRAELLHWVLLSLGQTIEGGASYVQLYTQFQTHLIAEYGAGRRTVLIFDEAQNLSAEVLEELRMFSNINADKDEVLQIVLVGQPELRETIKRPQLVQFAQRISANFHLPAMNAQCVHDYIAHRMQIAGATRPIFSSQACEKIHAASGGVPRVVNKICDHALTYAYSDHLTVVDEPVVGKVVSDWKNLGLRETETKAAPALPGSEATSASLAKKLKKNRTQSSIVRQNMGTQSDKHARTAILTLDLSVERQNQSLDAVYPIVHFERLWIKIGEKGAIKNKAVHAALGLGSRGERRVLGVWIFQHIGAKSWLSVLSDLKHRGAADILVATAETSMGFPEALAAIFPQTAAPVAVPHLNRSHLALVARQDRKLVGLDLQSIYLAAGKPEALERLGEFTVKWNSAYPTIADALQQHLAMMESFITLPQPLRGLICADDAPGAFSRLLNRTIRDFEPFSSDQTAIRKLWETITQAENQWATVKDWDLVTPHLASHFGSRFSQFSDG